MKKKIFVLVIRNTLSIKIESLVVLVHDVFAAEQRGYVLFLPGSDVIANEIGEFEDLLVRGRTNVAVDQLLEKLEPSFFVDESTVLG